MVEIPYDNQVKALHFLVELNESLRNKIKAEENNLDYVKRYGTVFCSAGCRSGNTTTICQFLALCSNDKDWYGYFSYNLDYSNQVVQHIKKEYCNNVKVVGIDQCKDESLKYMILDRPTPNLLRQYQENLNSETILIVIGGMEV